MTTRHHDRPATGGRGRAGRGRGRGRGRRHTAPSGRPRTPRRGRRLLRTLLPAAVSVAALVALVVAADPGQIAGAARRFRLAWLPVVLLLSASFFVVQGLRWHLLLRTAGVRLRVRDTVGLNIAGQATALLPLGELTRAVFVAGAAGAPLGVVVATVTVQELIYTLLLIAAAVPGSLQVHGATVGVLAALVGTVLALVILTVDRVFRPVLAVVRRTPLLARLTPTVEQLQADTVGLLRHRGTYLWSWLSALQGLLAVTTFWLVAVALGAPLAWHTAALVYAVSHIIGAVSLVPGGLGAYEAGASATLVAVGVRFSLAATTALCEKLATKGLGTLAGAVVYAAVRRRYGFGHGGVLAGLRQARSPGRRPGDVTA